MNMEHPIGDPDRAALGGQHLDVLIVGAGISGIDAAHHLQDRRPDATFAMVESKDRFGGTWATHKFPGIRSDSDLYTFGFKWKPWKGLPIASADEILIYLDEAIEENDLRDKIHFRSEVVRADWDSETQRWTVTLRQGPEGEETQLTCGFLWMCAGYYRHSEGYMPDWPGMDQFKGPIIHPQTWPEDLDYAGKRVVVIGSGATAATLIPAMAKTAAHITMLQRSPTYYYPRPKLDEFGETLKALELDDALVHDIMRRKFLYEQKVTIKRSFTEPDVLARELIDGARAYLGPDYDIETHFTPSYRPWRQRVAMVPDGDLFRTIRSGKASVVTDSIARFTETGLTLESGDTLEADIIVAATGLTLNALGDVALIVDGKPVDIADSWTHRGIMFSGIPNLASVFGYLRTSWTMRADLVSDYVCRVMDQMQSRQARSVVPALREQDQDMIASPWIDPENFNSGYITRGLHLMLKQGDHQPWVMTQDYHTDKDDLPAADLDDGTLIYS